MLEVPKAVKLNCFILENDLEQLVVDIILIYIITMKVCGKCKVEQSILNFGLLKSAPDGHRYDCKQCRKEYRDSNKEKIKEKQHEYFESNKELLLEKNKQYRADNIEKINIQRKEYRNREEIKKHIKEKNKEYLPSKKEKIKHRRKTDINFQISEILRSKIHKMIKGHTTTYQDIVGCDIEFLKKWIEYRFDKNMCWDNLGKYWAIDHIIPINAFNFINEKDIKICFHWTNLQPLTCFENRSKSDKLQLHYYFNNIVSIHRFHSKYKQFMGYQMVNESLSWLRDNELRYGKNPTDDNTNVLEMDNQQPSS